MTKAIAIGRIDSALVVFLAAVLSGPLATSQPLQVADQSVKKCLDRQRVDRLSSLYTWTTMTSEIKYDPCDPNNIGTKVMQALIDIEDLPRLNNKKDDFSQGILGDSVTRYIRDHITEFIFDRSDSRSCRDNSTAAYVRGSYGPAPAYVCPQATALSTFMISTILVHEARHLDGLQYGHVRCNHGHFGGSDKLACDPSYSSQGSHAVAAELSVRVARTESLPLSLRQEARAAAVNSFLNYFNQRPFGLKSGILLHHAKGPVMFLDRQGETSEVLPSVSRFSVLTLRKGVPVFMDSESGTAKSYVFSKEMTDARGTYASDYRTKFTPEQRRSLKDVLYTAKLNCMLFEDSIQCDSGSEDHSMGATLKFDSIHPRSLLQTQSGLAIEATDGYLYLLPGDISKLKSLKVDALQRVPNTHGYMNFVEMEKGSFIGLNSEGTLLQTKNWRSVPSVIPVFQNERFLKIAGPYIWSKRLEEL